MPALRTSILAVVCALAACATGERMRRVHDGMWKDEVVALLGAPDEAQRIGEYEALRYDDRLVSDWSSERTDYTVILRGGRVVASGPGRVRSRDPNTGVLVIVPLE
jgi:hypothetical protein